MSDDVFETTSTESTKRKWRRIHGLQWPWHPQQVVAWIILLYFTLFTFCVIIPNYNTDALQILTGKCFIIFKRIGMNCALPTAIIGSLKVSNLEGAVVKTEMATFSLLIKSYLIVSFLKDFDELISKILKIFILDHFCWSS